MHRRTFLETATAGLALRQGSPRRYRVALIGATGRGNYGHDWDLAWNGLPNVEVVAVADPDEQGRRKAMARSHASKGYADYRDMLAAEKPDIVTICPRWLDQREAMATAAAEAGAHILVEKPFAATVEQADRIVAAADRHRIKVQVGHTARPMGVTRKALALLREGQLGVLMEMRARGKEDRRAGGEDLMVLGTHTFDLLRYFAGDPQWVFAHASDKGREVAAGTGREGTEPIGRIAGDDIAAMFLFPRGVHGYFGSKSTDVIDGRRFGVTLYGSKAALYMPLTDVPGAPPYLLRRSDWVGGEWERIGYPPDAPVLRREQVNQVMAADLLEAIEQDREPVCSARDARWTIEMAAGIYQSQMSGGRVAFPLRDRSTGRL
jgi:predicted dehydrogenase